MVVQIISAKFGKKDDVMARIAEKCSVASKN